MTCTKKLSSAFTHSAWLRLRGGARRCSHLGDLFLSNSDKSLCLGVHDNYPQNPFFHAAHFKCTPPYGCTPPNRASSPNTLPGFWHVSQLRVLHGHWIIHDLYVMSEWTVRDEWVDCMWWVSGLYVMSEWTVCDEWVDCTWWVSGLCVMSEWTVCDEWVDCAWWVSGIRRVGKNYIYTPYMTIYLIISLPKTPYVHRISYIYMVLAKPNYTWRVNRLRHKG